MDSDDYELPDYDGKDDAWKGKNGPGRWPPVWPLLVLIGLLTIAIGTIGPLLAR